MSEKCPTCRSELTSPIVCESCHSLFPGATPDDYFHLFGLPQTYDIDTPKLRTRYRALARAVHPDRFACESSDTIALATQLSAAVNEAYQNLADPVRRAEYLLQREGGPTAAQLRDVPGDLLVEVMQLREEWDQARDSGNMKALAEKRMRVQQERDECREKIALGAQRLAMATDGEKRELRLLLNAVKYWDNLREELAEDPLVV